VLSTSGDTHLGGDDFDKVNRSITWLPTFKSNEACDLRQDQAPCSVSTEAAEKAKIELSQRHPERDQSAVHTRPTPEAPSIFDLTRRRPSFEELASKLDRSLPRAGGAGPSRTPSYLHQRSLMMCDGGRSTRIPAVLELGEANSPVKGPNQTVTPNESGALLRHSGRWVLAGRSKDILLLGCHAALLGCLKPLGGVMNQISPATPRPPPRNRRPISRAVDGQPMWRFHVLHRASVSGL